MSTPQEPINSGFGAASTAADVIQGIDLTGKVVIVTGGYSGLGWETTQFEPLERRSSSRRAIKTRHPRHWQAFKVSRSKQWT